MSKRSIALALLVGGALLAATSPKPVAADDGSFPLSCIFHDSATSTKPLVITVHISCGGNGDPNATIDDASLIGPATVHFYSGTNINWTGDVQVPAVGTYQLRVTATYSDPGYPPASGTSVCCSVQAYGAAAATPTSEPPPPVAPAPVSTPRPPAPTPKPKPAPAATPAPTATPTSTATPSPSPTDTPHPTETVASSPPSAAPSPPAEVASSPPASASNSPIPAAAGTTGNQDPSGVSPYLLAGAVAAILAVPVLFMVLVVGRRRKRHDRSPEPSETVT
jgi:hypothetical protein